MGDMSFRAIATAYRRFEFRSRLEAKWAVFFDLCRWPWSYEPIDLNGWIPDFAIGQKPTLVEIKPFFKYAEWADHKQKILESGCKQPVILLGADPVWVSVEAPKDEPASVWSETPSGAPIIGWLFDPSCGPDGGITYHLHFGITEGNGKVGLCPNDGPWVNFVWDWERHPATSEGGTDKWARVWLNGQQCETELVERCAKASNVSQWIKSEHEHHRS